MLYFTVVNSDLGLRHLEEKQRGVALRNMPLTLTCFDEGVNPEMSGAWGRSHRRRGGVQGDETSRPKRKKKS